MKLGIDINIQTCRDEGYMVMEYNVLEFNKNPRTTDCRFTTSLPVEIRKEMGWSVGKPIIDRDCLFDYECLYERYMENKEGIDSFIGDEHPYFEHPDPRDLLFLASDIDAYCGLCDGIE